VKLQLVSAAAPWTVQWINIEMFRKVRIRTLYIAAPHGTEETTQNYLQNARIHIGDNPTPTANPMCSPTISDSGVYTCNLLGKFVGIVRTCSNGLPLRITELMAFNTVIMPFTPSAVPASAEEIGTNDGTMWLANSSAISQCTRQVPRYWNK
jgi:hypothetical protein